MHFAKKGRSAFFSPVLPSSRIKQHSTSRTMAAGRCTAIVRVGTIEIPCPCTEGIFTIAPLSTLEVTCKKCSHLLSDHQDTQTDPSPTENLTPVSNYEEREGQILCPNNYFTITADNDVKTDSL